VLLSREITSSFLGFSLIIAIVLGVSLIISYLFSKILRNAESPYSVLLGNFMILNGFYCLICAFFIPNIGTLELTQMNPLSIDSSFYMIFLIMAAFGVFLVGVYLRQEGITSLKDLYQRKSASKSDKIEKIS
jgi:predicted transporter